MIIVIISIVAAIILAEIIIKKKAEEELQDDFSFELDPLPIKVQKLHNYGMANSFLKEKPEVVKVLGVIIMTILVLVFILLLPLRGKNALKIALALILGGGLSNLLDRFLKGYVTDYFSFKTPFKRLNRLVFNISDMCIFVGAILVVLAECCKRAD